MWEPRYLVAPGGVALPRILIDVSVLIAGGMKELFRSLKKPLNRRAARRSVAARFWKSALSRPAIEGF